MELNKIIQLKNKVDRQLTDIRLSVNVDEHQFMSDLLQKEIEKQEAFLEAFKWLNDSGKLKFKDYNELPFPDNINKLMFSIHQHLESGGCGGVYYSEDDVTVLLQTMMNLIRLL